MIYDIHAHIAGMTPATKARLSAPRARQSAPLRYFTKRMGMTSPGRSDLEQIQHAKTQLLTWVDTSCVDRIVLLALDGAYRQDGDADPANTVLMVDNDEVAEVAAQHPKLLFGASVHPARRDAIATVETAAQRGACLVKWIPSAQNIQPDNPAFIPFYEALSHLKLPLLVHTGNEHTLRRFSNSLNDPRRLKQALARGVTVIGAHCGTRLFLHEKSYFAHWKAMASEHENFYGDLSAFGLPLHGSALQEILGNPTLAAKVLYGSDFPVVAPPACHIFKLGLRTVTRLSRRTNPFDKTYLTLRGLGVPDEVFERAGRLLRLPAPGAPAEHEGAGPRHHE